MTVSRHSHCDGSFEYPQRMFWLRNGNSKFQLHVHTLIWRSDGSVVDMLTA